MIYFSVKEKQEQLTRLEPPSDSYKAIQHDIMLKLVECRDLISRSAMFSVNEEVDDISTEDIQYKP